MEVIGRNSHWRWSETLKSPTGKKKIRSWVSEERENERRNESGSLSFIGRETQDSVLGARIHNFIWRQKIFNTTIIIYFIIVSKILTTFLDKRNKLFVTTVITVFLFFFLTLNLKYFFKPREAQQYNMGNSSNL